MNRILAIMLVLMLCVCAQAELVVVTPMPTPVPTAVPTPMPTPAPTPVPPDAFEFNGLFWGSSIEQVVQAQGEYEDEYSEERWFQLAYMDVPVSNYTADRLFYIFQDGKLRMIGYGFEEYVEGDAAYLTKALEEKYGTPIAPDLNRLCMLMSMFDEVDREEYQEILGSWELTDGTYIASFIYDDIYFILYFDEAELLKNPGYNTSGL